MPSSHPPSVHSPPPAGVGGLRGLHLGGLPGHIAQSVWRASEVGHASAAVVATGFPALDAQLPGAGWPCNALTELLQPQPGVCEWRLLAPALAGLASAGGSLVLVGPPKCPHPAGLAQLGIVPSSLVWVATDTPVQRLWVTEQLIASNPLGGAILVWLDTVHPAQLRRLQVHAQACDCPVFVLRPESARHVPSPAPLRVLLRPGADWTLQLHIFKRRGASVQNAVVLDAVSAALSPFLPPRLAPLRQPHVPSEVSHARTVGCAVDRRHLSQPAAH